MSVKEPDFCQSDYNGAVIYCTGGEGAARHRTTLNTEPTISLDLITVLTAVFRQNYEEVLPKWGRRHCRTVY